MPNHREFNTTGPSRSSSHPDADHWNSSRAGYDRENPYDGTLWNSSRAGYAREDPYDGTHGYYRDHPASSNAAGAQGGYSYPAWPTGPSAGVAGMPYYSPPDACDYSMPEERFPRDYYAGTPARAPAPVPAPHTEAFHAPRRMQIPFEGDGRGSYCQARDCPAPPSYSVDGNEPAVLCGNHREDGMYRVQHNDRICGYRGCHRLAATRHMAEDGRIVRCCSAHKMPEMVAPSATHCEYAGCDRTPRYGPKMGPMSFCQAHKRAGMFATQNGELLVATRDGNAFRPADPPRIEDGATASDHAAEATGEANETPTESAPIADRMDFMNPMFVPGRNTPLYRKLCEVPGCPVQPSYGEAGTTRPRFCSGHKQKGMVGLKNRPCIYPGCNTRPHYGLSRGRSVYCVKHKEDHMVHLLKESKAMEQNETDSKHDEPGTASAEKNGRTAGTGSKEKSGEPATNPKEKRAEEEEAGEQNSEGEEHEQDEEEDEGKDRGRGKKSSKRKVTVAGSGKKAREISRARPSSSCPPPSSPPLHKRVRSPEEPPSSTEHAEDAEVNQTNASTRAKNKQTPPLSRMEELAGMAPSVEMKLLREARESARAVAEASGSGRRARAPSRKALEASGKLTNDGVQWMTKEKREEQSRLKKELKEQRKAAAVAGLKVGHAAEAVEVFAVAITCGSKTELGGSGRSSSSGGGGRGGGAVGNAGEQALLLSSPPSSQLSPSENTPTAGRQPTVEGAATQQKAPGRDATATAKEGAAAMNSKEGEDLVAPAAAAAIAATAVGNGEESAKKRKKLASEGKHGVQRDSTAATVVDSTMKSKRGRRASAGITDDGGKEPREQAITGKVVGKRRAPRGKLEGRVGGGGAAGKGATGASNTTAISTCEFKSCPKTATFGVNGVVRYCKAHCLFGMHKIADKK